MIYPKKINSKKVNIFFRISNLVLILISILLIIINTLTTPNIYWSPLCILGFIYIYLTVKFSIITKTNIAHHVMFQTLLTSIFMFFIDYRIGYSGWSINIALPILIIISNIAMFIITITNYKHYAKYATSQLIIMLLSLTMTFFIYKGYCNINPLINIAIILSLIGFLISLILCHKDLKEEFIRKFNI